MDKKKADGVVEAVHYTPDGQVAWIRAYERRGTTYSDVILLDRNTLIARLKSGKRFYAGQRIPMQASTFTLTTPFHLVQNENKEILVTGHLQADHDLLEGVPII